MRLNWIFGIALTIAAPAMAQGPETRTTLAAQAEAMKLLDWMQGVWRGPADQGERQIIQTERVGSFLDGTVRVIEGRGYNSNGGVEFNALGVVSYDPATKSFWLNSWAQGYAGKFPLTVKENGFAWERAVGPQTIRYTATLVDGSWIEVGDIVVNGQPVRRIFSMKLKRVADTEWPSAGTIPKE